MNHIERNCLLNTIDQLAQKTRAARDYAEAFRLDEIAKPLGWAIEDVEAALALARELSK